MKHLEELEAELEEVIEETFILGYNLSKDYDKLSPPDYKKLCKVELLKRTLLERKILQAYDAIEERKRYIMSVMVTVMEDDTGEVGRYMNATYLKQLHPLYLKDQIEKAFKKVLSDYEWEWLKQQNKEGGDD